jgi:hypothetical protein
MQVGAGQQRERRHGHGDAPTGRVRRGARWFNPRSGASRLATAAKAAPKGASGAGDSTSAAPLVTGSAKGRATTSGYFCRANAAGTGVGSGESCWPITQTRRVPVYRAAALAMSREPRVPADVPTDTTRTPATGETPRDPHAPARGVLRA